MNIDQELSRYSPELESVLTIGVFDGVHRGHRHLISELITEARGTGRLAGIVTFRNHPTSVLSPDFKARYLTTVEERLHLIEELGVDYTVPLSFDRGLSKLRAGQFAALLQQHLRMTGLVIGPDFAMGHRREGDTETLAAIGRDMGFSVHVVKTLLDEDGQVVRSTGVRDALVGGDVSHVAALLGRNFVLTGTVVRGVGRGGPLGFPTANIEVSEGMAIPGDGIYVTWAYVDQRRHMAATSIGELPTFGEGERTVEAYVLDLDEDLYDQQVRLEFVRRLRDEIKFDSVRALQEQVDKDVDQTRAILQTIRPDPS